MKAKGIAGTEKMGRTDRRSAGSLSRPPVAIAALSCSAIAPAPTLKRPGLSNFPGMSEARARTVVRRNGGHALLLSSAFEVDLARREWRRASAAVTQLFLDCRLQICRYARAYATPSAMNWDDLRIIAAVRERGTYAGASARLRMDETTVARRVARIQASLGATLFDAVDGARKPTAYCEAILAHVHEIAQHVAEIGNVGKAALGVVGKVRIATTPIVAEEILAPRTAQFLRANPGLILQIKASEENINFSRWEADLAVRLRRPERGDFTITKLAEMRLYLFEPVNQRAAHDRPIVCCFPEELDHTPESQCLLARRLYSQGRCITENSRVVYALIKAHAAIGILPGHMCAELLRDRRLRATPLATRQEVWLLVLNHFKRGPTARAVIDWVRDSFSALAAR